MQRLLLALATVLFVFFAAGPSPAQESASAVNQVPYVSTYYIKPKVLTGEPIVINYYVTGFDHKEYMQDDRSDSFSMDYWVNGGKTTVSNVKAGDNSITLKPMPKGKVLFALQATDGAGRKSHRLFSEFLVVNAKDSVIAADKVLQPDLAKFQIFNNDTHPEETTKGLTAMLKWASDNGYRKVVLPKGRYRIDEKRTVQMATKLTLDMNGATFKLNPNALGGALMFEFINCFDSHVINGTFEGDLKEHDFEKAPNHSEWLNAICMSQGSEYCTVKDVTVVDITGYGTTTMQRHTYDKTQPVKGFAPGDIDAQGQRVNSDVRTTSDGLIDISAYMKSFQFIQLGIYLGYQGNPAGHWVYKAHFYDADQKYLESIEGYLYRRLYPPSGAHFVKFTLLSKATPQNLAVYNFRPPYNCAYINVSHRNVRCVGMALAGFNNMLVEGNTFENCGWALARCAFDAEDGWDMMQDLTFRNNVFGKNPANEFLTAGGHNFVMENNVMRTYNWDRTNSYVLRNNTLKDAAFLFGKRIRTGYPRVTNNVIQGGVSLNTQTAEADGQFCIRDNVLKTGAGSRLEGKATSNAFYYKCKISGGALNARVVASEIKDTVNSGGTFEIQDSKIENCKLKTSGYQGLSKIAGSTIINSPMSTQGGTMVLENNTIRESDCTAGGDWSDGHEFILTGNKIETSMDHLVLVGNSYKQVVLRGNTFQSSNPAFSAVQLNNPTNAKLTDQKITIEDNIFNAKGGFALNVNRMPPAANILTVRLVGNVFNGLQPTSPNLLTAPNARIISTK